MSWRATLRAIVPVARGRALFAATPSRAAHTGAAAAGGASDAFGDLANITAASSPAAPSLPTPAAAPSPVDPTSARGYRPGALAPHADPVLDLVTNLLMKHGKKAEAQKRVSNILALVQRATNSPPLPQLHRAIELSSPSVRVLSMRKSAKTVHTPRGLTERQRTRTGVMWLLKAAERGRKGGLRRDDRIAREILAVLDGSSDVFKKVDEVHRSAMMNRSNLHAR